MWHCRFVPPIRTILVDDSLFFLQAAMAFLQSRPGLQVCGHTLFSHQAVPLAILHNADLVLLDLSMPGATGIEIARALKQLPKPPKVVIVSFHDTPAHRDAALAAGADGFVGKSSFAVALLPLLNELFPSRQLNELPQAAPSPTPST